MIPAHDAIILDSTQLTLEQVVERMEQHVLNSTSEIRNPKQIQNPS
jgi:cytidylate kinase